MEVKHSDQQVIDSWPLDQAGLPVRVVTAALRYGLRTVGELRRLPEAELRAMRGIGVESVGGIRLFFRRCQALDAGASPAPTFRDALDAFLNRPEIETLETRYELMSAENGLPRSPTTLQAIGNLKGVTRERVRQLEARAKAGLASRLAQAFLEPVYAFFEAAILADRPAVPAAEMAGLEAPVVAPFNPARVLALLSECGGRVRYRDGFFTTLADAAVERVQSEAARLLRECGRGLRLDDILAGLGALPLPADPRIREEALRCILDRSPGLSATRDGRYFDSVAGSAAIVTGLLRQAPGPMRFQRIVEEFNALVKPGSRKGAGSIRSLLRDRTLFQPVGAGRYAPCPPPAMGPDECAQGPA